MAEIDTPKPVLVGLTVDKVALGQAFLRIFKFSILVSFHQCSILISFLCHMLYNISNCHCYENTTLKNSLQLKQLGFAVQAVDEVQEISLTGCG